MWLRLAAAGWGWLCLAGADWDWPKAPPPCTPNGGRFWCRFWRGFFYKANPEEKKSALKSATKSAPKFAPKSAQFPSKICLLFRGNWGRAGGRQTRCDTSGELCGTSFLRSQEEVRLATLAVQKRAANNGRWHHTLFEAQKSKFKRNKVGMRRAERTLNIAFAMTA